MARYKAIHLKFAENWEEEYRIGEKVEAEESVEVQKAPYTSELSTAEAEAEAVKIRLDKLVGRKTSRNELPKPRAKKS
jgi:hypothetical protein